MSDTYYAYLVRCNDGSLYAGYAADVSERVATHNAGKGAKYTRSRLPVELVFYESFSTKSEAMSREAAIKKLSRAKKIELVQRGMSCVSVQHFSR